MQPTPLGDRLGKGSYSSAEFLLHKFGGVHRVTANVIRYFFNSLAALCDHESGDHATKYAQVHADFAEEKQFHGNCSLHNTLQGLSLMRMCPAAEAKEIQVSGLEYQLKGC